MAMSVAKEAFDFDLPAVCKELRTAAQRVAHETGTRPITVPPPMTVGWVLIAMLDDTSGDGHRCYGSPAYFCHKTGVSLATLYRVWDLFEAIGAYEQVPAATGRSEHRWHLEKLPRKAPWVSPKRGRPRTNAQAEKASQVEKIPSQVEKIPSQVEKIPSQVEKKPLPLRLPEVPPIPEPVTGELRSDPGMIQDRSYTDPPLAGRILSATPLWLKVREALRRGFQPAQWDSWVEPLRLYRAEDSGEYILTGRSLAQVEMVQRVYLSSFRYMLACELGTPVELRVMHQLDLEQAAAHGREANTSVVYPPLEPAGTGG